MWLFLWACRALNSQKRWFSAWAVTEFALTPEALPEAQLKSEACLRQNLWFGWSNRVRRAAAEMAAARL